MNAQINETTEKTTVTSEAQFQVPFQYFFWRHDYRMLLLLRWRFVVHIPTLFFFTEMDAAQILNRLITHIQSRPHPQRKKVALQEPCTPCTLRPKIFRLPRASAP